MKCLVAMMVMSLGACGSSGKSGDDRAKPEGAKTGEKPSAPALSVPAIDGADVAADVTGVPPLLVLVDDTGKLSLAAASSWRDLASVDSKRGKPVDADTAHKIIVEAKYAGYSPQQVIEHFESPAATPADDVATRKGIATHDDPPPPPSPDDSDDSGGTGTAMALDEGKMGKTDRAPKRSKPRDHVVVTAGGFGYRSVVSADDWKPRPGDKPDDPNDPPNRVSQTAGEVIESKHLADHQPALVLVDPHAKATELIDAVANTDGMIGVTRDGQITALRVQFVTDRSQAMTTPPWIEVRVGARKTELELVPDAPVVVTDAASIKAAYLAARDRGKLEPIHAVDILVAPEVDAQRVVDMIVALDRAGARTIGLGKLPGPLESARRGHRH